MCWRSFAAALTRVSRQCLLAIVPQPSVLHRFAAELKFPSLIPSSPPFAQTNTRQASDEHHDEQGSQAEADAMLEIGHRALFRVKFAVG
jgi:hypothetical protein